LSCTSRPPPAVVVTQAGKTMDPTDKPEASRPILDGATPREQFMPPDIVEVTEIAKDISKSMDERMEAFDDVLDSEVGDTTLSRARNIERSVGMRQIYLKFEGGNPTGTQKDRIAFVQAGDALRRGFDTITVATCGNYGVAVSLAASLTGLRCVVYIPRNYQTNRVREMEELGAEIIRTGEDYESAVDASRARADADEWYDANPGGQNTSTQLRAYGQIAYEIYDELRDAPAVVCVPVSNGTTLAWIYKGFLSLYRRGKTSKIPRMVAASSSKKNPIVRSWIKNLPRCENLEPTEVRETRVNEPLINWHSIDGDLALEAIRETGGWAVNASDKKLVSISKMIREREGLSVLPASAAGLIALLDRHASEPFPGDRYVAVLTGKR
jgi:threonine synthase